MKAVKEFTKGIFKENPVFRLVLGMCPVLAITTSAVNGVGMGAAATFVLLGSNIVISLLRKFISGKVRIPAFITVIAGFVTIVQLVMKAYFPSLDKALGVFIPLIVVNCIILARAEMFASSNKVSYSVLDALGMGIGFTISLVVIGMIREFLGAGTFFNLPVTKGIFDPVVIFILPAGGFLTLGILMGIVNKISNETKEVKECADCPMKCHMLREGNENSQNEKDNGQVKV